MSTCLITGGAGNLARQFSQILAERYDRLVLVDIAETVSGTFAANAIYERADLSIETDIRRLMSQYQPTAIVHLASQLSASCEQDRRRGGNVNADGTFFLLNVALEYGVATFLFASWEAAFGGDLADPLSQAQDAPQWPDGLYGVTKMACDRLGVYYHRRHGLDFRCLRLPITIARFAPRGAASAFASHAFVESANHGHYRFRIETRTRLALIYLHDAIGGLASLLGPAPARLTRRVCNIRALTVTPHDIAQTIRSRLPTAQLTHARMR